MGSTPGMRAMGSQAGTEMSPGFMDWWNNRAASGAGGLSGGGMFGIGRNAPAPNYSLGGPSGTTPIAPTTTGTATSGPALPPPMVLPAPRVNLAQIMNAAQQYTGRSQASMRR